MKVSVPKVLLSVVTLVAIQGCIAPQYDTKTPKPYSKTIKAHGSFPLKKALSRTDKPLGTKSGFYPLPDPVDALAARLYLIDHAVKSIDLQYYIYENDTIGKTVSAHLYKAAQRGVKVRLLLDDISTTGKDKALAKLATHPNISLRIFNPNRFRTLFRTAALLFDLDTLGKRMHNKALVADGYAAIVGGRNIGDVYFASDRETLFVDYDMLCIGSVVDEISHAFDLYYNSPPAQPAETIVNKDVEAIASDTPYRFLARFYDRKIGRAVAKSRFMRLVAAHTLTFDVADKSYLFYDSPQKVLKEESARRYHLAPLLERHLEPIRDTLILVSPYFIPNDKMIATFATLRHRGVKVVVITNSLAATDVFPVYSGYRNRIEALKKAGVTLYELKTDSIETILSELKIKRHFKASLHTKMIILDNDRLVVGSANLDPRSDKLNTELMLLLYSRKIASKHKRMLEKILNPQTFYVVKWEPYKDNDGKLREGIVWETIENGKTVRYLSPPHAPFWKSFLTDLLRFFPVEGYL